MLLLLAEYLTRYQSGFNVFSYLTLRAILAVITALAIALLVGPALIERLTRHQIGQRVRDDGPQSHLPKAGTPTMGGALILVAIAVSTLLWADPRNRFVWIALGVTMAFGLIGFYDDYLKLIVGNSKGLAPRYKYFWQSLAGLGAATRALPHGAHPGRDLALRAVLQARRAAARRRLRRAHLLRHRGHQQRGESHRRARRSGDHAGGDGRRRARRIRVLHRQQCVRGLPRHSLHRGRRRDADLLRDHRRRGARLSLVQRLSRAGVHGRHRRARARRRARRGGRDRAAGDRARSSWAACSCSRRCR